MSVPDTTAPYWSQVESPLVMILIFAAAVSLGLAQWVDAAIILVIVIGSTLLGFYRNTGLPWPRRGEYHRYAAFQSGANVLDAQDSPRSRKSPHPVQIREFGTAEPGQEPPDTKTGGNPLRS